MKEFFLNPWVVGIFGGIISGVIVFFISSWIMRKKNNFEYIRQIEIANKEVINGLKPYIADNVLPSEHVINAIIASVSRTYKVRKEEMFSITIFCEELIREIIQNVYISSDKKFQYTKQLSDYIITLEGNSSVFLNNEFTEINLKDEYNGSLINQFSYILAGTVAMSVLFLTRSTLKYYSIDDLLNLFNKYVHFIIIILPFLMITIMCVTRIDLKRQLKKEYIDDEEK